MRDIRGDLQERAILVDEQIRAAVAHFDKAIQQLQTERDARIGDLKASLAMLAKLMEFEERLLHNTPPATPASPYNTPPATPASPHNAARDSGLPSQYAARNSGVLFTCTGRALFEKAQ